MKVAILGFGIEGEATLRYFHEKNADITVFDEAKTVKEKLPPGVHFNHVKNGQFKADGFDVVVRGPAIHPNRVVANGKLTSATALFFEDCRAPIIGVTGSKGKGTTSSLIFEMLTRAGVRAHLVGNIGIAALDILPDIRPSDVVVFELSSFQLWDMHTSPHIAVVLMIEPDHLDVHQDMQEYITAKANITRWQKKHDIAIFLPENEPSVAIAQQSKGTRLGYGKPPAAYVKNSQFIINEQFICSINDLLLPGKHNVLNTCAAITAAWQYTQDVTALAEALQEFSGLEHRLKFVAEKHGVKYYDDSIATTPGSAIAAVKAFDQPKVLILGGSSKGADFGELANTLTNADMRRVLLIGDEAPRIAEALEAVGFANYDNLESMRMPEIIELAADIAQPADIVILSPACASFGMFENYKDRGNQFIAAVHAL
ncbi:MAG TPA: UDP-N-acetylmuramoyl-L-alanine--D-glutamate ligase [Candidatus Saccharimonadales bacterium]